MARRYKTRLLPLNDQRKPIIIEVVSTRSGYRTDTGVEYRKKDGVMTNGVKPNFRLEVEHLQEV